MFRSSHCTMGTLFCCCCGAMASLDVSSDNQQPNNNNNNNSGQACHVCGTLNGFAPGSSTASLLKWSSAELAHVDHTGSRYVAERETTWQDPAENDSSEKSSPTQEEYCEKCGVIRVCWYRTAQLRSADEGQTVLLQCTTCMTSWRVET
eukprot:PhM_4_TR4050/c0_g1_i1/m.99506/K03000/RPA12, ZNRD1; DNA-directed RNA polymerase I subunit RPA12